MRLVPLAREHLETVRLLRNRSRHAFFDTREISADAEMKWFEQLAGKPVQFFLIEEDGRIVGTISVTDTSHGREIGNLVLDEAYRGRGLMRQAVEELTRTPGDYFAEVRAGNDPSLRVFAAAGFASERVRLRKRVD